jgi:hypothetical protein
VFLVAAPLENHEFMIPEKVIVTAKGEFKPGLAVRLKFGMSRKNDYIYTAFLDSEGVANVPVNELLRSFSEDQKLFLMDFCDPREFFTGHIEAHVLSKEEIEKSISAIDTFKHYDYPSNHLENLKRALVSNAESKCVISVEQIALSQSNQKDIEEQSWPIKKHCPVAFAYQAAKGSWASSVIVFFLLVFSSTGARVILELIALLLILAGLSLGIIALFGIRKHGTKNILAPALVGIIINGLLFFIFANNFLAARHAG